MLDPVRPGRSRRCLVRIEDRRDGCVADGVRGNRPPTGDRPADALRKRSLVVDRTARVRRVVVRLAQPRRAGREGAIGLQLEVRQPDPVANGRWEHGRDVGRGWDRVARPARQTEQAGQEVHGQRHHPGVERCSPGGELGPDAGRGADVGVGDARDAVSSEPGGSARQGVPTFLHRGRWHRRSDPIPGFRPANDPRRLARRVALDRDASRRVRGPGADPGQRQREAVRGDGMPRHMGEQDRAIGYCAVEIVAGRVVRTVPAGRVVAGDEPRVGLQVLGGARHGPDRRPTFATGEEPHPGDDALPVGVGMGLHEPRQHGAPAQVDDVGVRPGERPNLRVAAHRQDPIVGEADRGRATAGGIRDAGSRARRHRPAGRPRR